MFQFHQEMLKPVLDTLSSTQSFIPVGDHSVLQKSWNEENYSLLHSNLREVSQMPQAFEKAERILDLATDAMSMFLKEAGNPTWQKMSVKEKKARIAYLKTVPQIEQRTDAWYEHYSKVLTASEFSTLFGSIKARRSLVHSKAFTKKEDRGYNRLACPTGDINAMFWGIRFEPIIKLILEQVYNCKIYEAGRITHTENGMLAASPDGIIEESPDPSTIGRLIEIKCPYSRVIGGEIPFDYWVQMQIQMEVCNLDECEYLEAEILSPKPNQEPADLSGCSIKGNIYLLKQDVEDGQPFHYKYLYGDVHSDKCPEVPKGYLVVETIPWGLKKWYRKVVSRDRGWYASTVIWQDAFWSDVQLAKEGKPYSVQEVEETVKKDVCLISDAPSPKDVCLISDD
jgi:putative phage-type endonuclease